MKAIVLKRETATQIWNKEIDGLAVEEVLEAFGQADSETQAVQDDEVAIVLGDDVAEGWLEILRHPPARVDDSLSRDLRGVFGLALGGIPEEPIEGEADNRWTTVTGQ